MQFANELLHLLGLDIPPNVSDLKAVHHMGHICRKYISWELLQNANDHKNGY